MVTSVKLEQDLKDRVRQLAANQRRSAHWVMREAILQYVDREEARKSFHEEAIAAWSEYQDTGQHLTGKEARDWLRGWGTEAETDIPPCHE